MSQLREGGGRWGEGGGGRGGVGTIGGRGRVKPYRIEDQHLREEVDSSVGDGGGEGVQLAEGAGLGLGEKTLDGVVRRHVGHIFESGGTQEVCYHLQLGGRGGEGSQTAEVSIHGIGY